MARSNAKRAPPDRDPSGDEDEWTHAAKRVKEERLSTSHNDLRRFKEEAMERPVRVIGNGNASAGPSNARHAASASRRPPPSPSPSPAPDADADADHDDEGEMESDDVEMEQDEFSDDDLSEGENIDWDNEAENIAALARVRQEKVTSTDRTVPEAGIIRSVRLVNFMNHKHFTFDNFGAKINFIVGHNGSGKSAVLTAIAIALGARASVTGRGMGVKDLIHRGADKATITVTLLNRGPLAFKRDKYPNQIVIERSFDKKGTTTYKFKADRDGPTLETKKAELDAILSHFSINMDSPLTLLTQDMAKSFLATADEAKLYAFFLGGSSLKQLSEQYQEVERQVEKMNRDVADSRNSIPSLEAKVDKYQRIVEAAEKRAQMEEDHRTVQERLAWAFVIEREEQIAKDEEALDKERKKLEKYDQVLAELETKREEIERNVEELNGELEELNRERAPLRQQREILTRQVDAKRSTVAQLTGTLREITFEMDGKTTELRGLEDKIKKRTETGTAMSPEEVRDRGVLKQLIDLRSNLVRQEPEARRRIPEIEEQLQRANDELRTAEGRRDDVSNRLKAAQHQQNNLTQQSSDPMAAFGTNMKVVMDAIAREQWRERPLGPLGQYVKLKDQRYRDIVQSVLGGLLVGFAVRFNEDKMKLMNILRTAVTRQGYVPGHGGKTVPQIFQHKGDLFDYSEGDLSSRGATILSVLDVTNEMVLRIMIDVARVESTFLAPSVDKAQDTIDDLTNRGQRQVLVFSADHFRSLGRGTYRESGPQQRWNGYNLFVQDRAAAINSLREQVETFRQEQGGILDECRDRIARARQLEGELQTARRNLTKIEQGMREGRRRIDILEDKLAAAQPESGDALQQAKDDAEKVIEGLVTDRDKIQDDINEAETEMRRLDYDLQTVKDKDAKFLPLRGQKKDALAGQAEQQLQCQEDKKFHEQRKVANTAKVAARERELELLQHELEGWTEAAEKLGARTEFSETKEALQRRLKALAKSLEEVQRRANVDVNEAVSRYNAVYKELKDIRLVCNRNAALVKGIEKGLRRRQDMWMNLRQHSATRVSAVFTYNLSTRGFEGTVTFDHNNGKLRLRVNTTASKAAAGNADFAKSANRLSGGERSYSTVCFLLALWETCPTTISCLDEWDVFLDNINRQLAGKLIMEGASSIFKQFILITPLDMGGLQVNGEHNKVIRLGDPERGQGTLPM